MQTLLWTVFFILLLVLVGFGFFLFFIYRKISAWQDVKTADKSKEMMDSVIELMKMTQKELSSTRDEIRGSLHKNTDSMEKRLQYTNRSINERLDKAAEVIMGVNSELGKVKEIGRNMKQLQDFLRSPKLRGNIGEQVLRDLLEQYFPRDHFTMQYRFNDGQAVDAVLKTDKGIIPIDSKFPMENFLKMMHSENEEEKKIYLHDFAKDVKKHIKDIARKYIVPSEGTVDFAVMYVPSETVYYEIIRHDIDLHKFAYEAKVFPVSPNSFYYFLKVIMIGLQGKKIEAAAQRILETLDGIRVNNDKFAQVLGVLTTHVSNAKNASDRVNNEYTKLSSQIENVRLLK